MIETEDMCEKHIVTFAVREGQYVLNDGTITFSVRDEQEKEMRRIITEVYDALKEKGYNPINQIVGYIMSGDPTYITSHKSARSLIMKVERDEILEELMENYIETRLK